MFNEREIKGLREWAEGIRDNKVVCPPETMAKTVLGILDYIERKDQKIKALLPLGLDSRLTIHGTYVCDNCYHEVGKLYFDECWGLNVRSGKEFDMQWVCMKCKNDFDGTSEIQPD